MPDCGRPTDSNLCRSHVDQLLGHLKSVPALHAELETTLCRLDKLAGNSAGKAAETPMVWQERAAEASFVLRNTLTTWARDLLPLHPEMELHLADDVGEVALWMARRPSWMASHPAAGELADEVAYAVRAAWRCVDRPGNRTSFEVGPCPEIGEENPCPGRVWAYIPTADDQPAMLRCTSCESEWNTTQWLRVGQRILKAMGSVVA